MSFAIVTLIHLAAFAGCFVGSAAKSLILRRPVLRPAELAALVRLDRLTGVSALVVLTSGLALLLAYGQPRGVYLSDPVFWIKIALFAAASLAVVSTKRPVRAARESGANWVPEGRIRAALLFDLGSLFVIALLGLRLAGRIG
ncbi:MAG: DUF2214 family protein [Rhodobacteraceae bacterium]|nr:DUF2214 family protein [Paracoccaceae bacterium]